MDLLTKYRTADRATQLRIPSAILVLLSLIIISTDASKAFNNEFQDDGGTPAIVLLIYTSAACSLVCNLTLLFIPAIISARNSGGGAKYRMHPGVTLTVDILSTFGILPQLVIAGILGYWSFDADARIPLSCALMMLVWIIHAVLFVIACKDVHRLRKEQIAKRRSLQGGVEAMVVDGGPKSSAGERLTGWVELEDQHDGQTGGKGTARTGGVGGGLSGVGKGF